MDSRLNSIDGAQPAPLRPCRRAVHATAPTAHGATARATLTLALGALGLIHVVDSLGFPWAWLAEALALALLAMCFFVAAQRADDKRVAWLLSGSVAAGLAIAAFYNFITAAVTTALPAAGLVVFIAIVLFACAWRHETTPAPLTRRRSFRVPSVATRAYVRSRSRLTR